MAFLGGLNKLLGKAGNVVRQDVLQPANKILRAPVNAVTNIPRALVTSPAEKQGTNLVNQAAQRYGYNQAFTKLLQETHPVADKKLDPGLGGFNDVNNAGLLGRYNSLHFKEGNNPDSTYQTVTHEGLHSAWPKLSPQQRAQFLNEAQQAVGTTNAPDQLGQPVPSDQLKPGIEYPLINGKTYDPAARRVAATPPAQFLNRQLSGKTYKGYGGEQSLNNLQSLPDNIQTEVHSYLPNYYAEKKQPLPANLAKYYSQYFNPSTFTPTPKTQPTGNSLIQQPLKRPNALNILMKGRR